jgi:hypothetical protein|tara:strand:+ start:2538 stop:2774 length:237 start_codon:yes stop_codon:yes gene_type:complete
LLQALLQHRKFGGDIVHTLAHVSGTLGAFYLSDYAFNTLQIPVLGFAMLAVTFVAVLFTVLTAFQEAEFMRGAFFKKR